MRKKKIKELIKEYFFIYPNIKLRVRQIEKNLKLPLPSIIRYCKELRKEGILKIAKTGNVVFYTANRINGKFLLEKKLFNIKQLYETNLINYIQQELHNPLIIVFGSYSLGEDIETSDIDLYIETLSKKDLELKKYEKILKRKIQFFVYKKITDIKNKHLANNILNGIILNNFIEVFK